MKSVRDPIDLHIGNRVRRARVARGISQAALGALVNLSFAEIQRYEKGQDRLRAGKLYEIARIFRLHTSYFFLEDDSHNQGSIFDITIATYRRKHLRFWTNLASEADFLEQKRRFFSQFKSSY